VTVTSGDSHRLFASTLSLDLHSWKAPLVSEGEGAGGSSVLYEEVSDGSVEREHHAHEQLRVVVEADLTNGARTLVPAG